MRDETIMRNKALKHPTLSAQDDYALHDAELFKNIKYFYEPNIDVEEILLIKNFCRIQKIAPGQTLFFRDDPSDGIYLILRGEVKQIFISRNGKETTLEYNKNGDWIGFASGLTNSGREINVVACTNVIVASIPKRAFDILI